MSEDWQIRAVYPGVRQNPPPADDRITPAGVDGARMEQFVAWNQNVAGKTELASGDIPVSGNAVNGPVATNSVGIAPATSVAVKDTNMLVSQDFTNPNTVVAAGNWYWYGDDGHKRLGCARLDCTSIQDDMVSNEILVVANENISVTVWVKWGNLAGSGQIVLGIEKYRKGRDPDTGGTVYMDVGGVDIASVASPGSSGGWTKLTGTYQVPAKGVDQLRFRFHVDQGITFGYVLWDEAEFKKTDLIGDDAVPGVQTTVDNVVTKLYGGTSSGYTHDDEAAALANTAQALTTNSSKVSQIEASSSSGTIAGDDFSYTGNILNNGWGGTNSGPPYYSGDGNNAAWQFVDSTVNIELISKYDWQGAGATSSTDYQKVQTVLSSSSYYDAYSGLSAGIALYGRISSDWSSYIKFEVRGDGTWKLGCNVTGSWTEMASGTCTAPGSGSTITLYCGDKLTANPRKFRAEISGVNIVSYTDPGTSVYGASYRKWGWGGVGWYRGSWGFEFFARIINPSDVNQWIGVDQ